jgi:soluble lytic murein transglycosylase-like protein
MVVARVTQTLAPILSVVLALCSTTSRADPIDWASSGGELFVTASLPSRGFMMEPPTIPQPTRARPPGTPSRIVATQNPSAKQSVQSPQTDDLPTEDYGETGLDPKLLHALVIIESAYNVRAVSPVGARGLTQLMPGTAAELGVRDVYDTEQNLRAGARYLAIQIRRFSDIRLALAAYNSGPNRVARLGRVPDISETQNYVRDGIDCYLALTAGRGIRNRSQCRSSGRR